MSSLPPNPPFLPPPPPPPFPPPPPGAGAAAGPALPWELRNQIGFVNALVETVKLFATAPVEAWARTRVKNDLMEPLLFSVVVSWIGIIISNIYGMMFKSSLLTMMPAEYRGRMGWLGASAGGSIFQMILAPLFVACGLFIGAGILHLCLMVVGALTQSTAGFEGTFRVAAYSAVADLAHVIPFVGTLIAFVWKLVLVVLGIVALHRTTQGKAVAAVLIPVVLCCGCAVIAIVFGAAAAFSTFNR
jgi:hypothetical protein